MTMRIITFIYCIAFVIIANAQSFVDGAYTYVVIDNSKNVEIYKANNISNDVIIPKYVSNEGIEYRVLEIGPKAFYNQQISKITIPSTCNKIWNDAFAECTSLEEVVIEDGSENLDLKASTYLPTFYHCPIKKLTIGRPVSASRYYTAFNGCPIEEFIVRGNMLSIPEYLGIGNEKLKKVDLCPTIEEIPGSCFSGSSELTDMDLPNVKNIGKSAFANCSSLKTIYGLDNLEYIGAYAFNGCTNLQKINLCNVKTISDRAFNNCVSLEDFEIPKCSKIGTCAFYGCTNLTKIMYPEGFEVIADGAYFKCNNITEISLPSTLKFIGNESQVLGSFDSCKNLQKVICKALTPPQIDDFRAFNGVQFVNAELIVPLNTLELYRKSDFWNKFKTIKEEDFYITGIDNLKFDNHEMSPIIYDFMGRRQMTTEKGIYIVKDKGKYKKVFIR